MKFHVCHHVGGEDIHPWSATKCSMTHGLNMTHEDVSFTVEPVKDLSILIVSTLSWTSMLKKEYMMPTAVLSISKSESLPKLISSQQKALAYQRGMQLFDVFQKFRRTGKFVTATADINNFRRVFQRLRGIRFN